MYPNSITNVPYPAAPRAPARGTNPTPRQNRSSSDHDRDFKKSLRSKYMYTVFVHSRHELVFMFRRHVLYA